MTIDPIPLIKPLNVPVDRLSCSSLLSVIGLLTSGSPASTVP